MNQTLVLCKPDAVERKLVGKIISRFEEKGLSISSMRMLTITPDIAALHYAEHVEKPLHTKYGGFPADMRRDMADLYIYIYIYTSVDLSIKWTD